MCWENVIGQEKTVSLLKASIQEGRISHAQLISGKNGWGTFSLALAYAAEIIGQGRDEQVRKNVLSLQHPDLHLTFPVVTTDSIKHPKSSDFINEFRPFILENPYARVGDWLSFYGVERKKGSIYVHEADPISKFASLRSYEGGYRVCIIWMAELMNEKAANKILKILEEPPEKVVFLLTSEREDLLLPTIYSRCQTLKLNRVPEGDILQFLVRQKGVKEEDAQLAASGADGNLQKALDLVSKSDDEYDEYLSRWVRDAFMAKTQPSKLQDMINWSQEISPWSRDKQIRFLSFCSEIFRQALLNNYGAPQLNPLRLRYENFKWEGFVPYIHGANIPDILEELTEASYQIGRNANPKILFLDLSIKLTRYLHQKKETLSR